MSQKTLKERTVKGVGWSAMDSLLGQGVTFLVGLVLARLLSPAEYGTLGLITIFITILNSFVDSGFSTAVLRKKDATNEDYNTMFITNLVLSIFMYAILFAGAPAIASFFDKPELISLSRVVGLVIIINALSLTQYTLLSKRLDFKTKTKSSLFSAIVSGIVGIALAFAGYGVWALVWQMIVKQSIYTICLWIFNHWAPRLRFSLQSFRYMWGFGWKMLVSGLLDTTWNQAYQLVVGKFYSPATLGQYSRSKEYASILSSNINSIVGRVTLPVLAEVQDDKERMLNAYRRIIKMTMFITAISMLALAGVSEPLIYCLIGPQWHQAATFLPLICISMSLYPLHAINLNMLKVQGRSDLFLILEIIKKIIAIGPILIGIFIGIYWMVAASVVTGIISFFINSHYSGKMIHYSSWMQIKDVAPFYGIGIVIFAAVYFMKYLSLNPFVVLPIQIITGTIVFFILCKLLHTEEYKEILSITKGLIKRK